MRGEFPPADLNIMGALKLHTKPVTGKWGLIAVLTTTLSIVMFSYPDDAGAVPSFTRQTGMACSACHTQSFGPNLTAMGREFKLGGYTMSNGQSKLPPVSAMAMGSFTHTRKDQAAGSVLPGYNQNNIFTFDQASLFYAGRIVENLGAFIQLTYDGYGNTLALDNTDIRYADQFNVGDNAITYGASINNLPSVQDLWNTTPAWGFPFTGSAVAPAPGATALLDGGLEPSQTGGGTAYTMIDDLLYLEAGAYASFGKGVQKALGAFDPDEAQIDGAAPYWRIALQYDWQGHYFMLGHNGFIADIFPGRDRSNGTDHITDVSVDATYQYMGDPMHHIFEVKTAYLYEDQNLAATKRAGGVNSTDNTYLSTFKFNMAYTYVQTYGITFGYNKTTGSKDTALYSEFSGGRPDSEYFITELVYVPFGKSSSYLQSLLNLRMSLTYIGYSQFNGSYKLASQNNTFMVNGWLAF